MSIYYEYINNRKANILIRSTRYTYRDMTKHLKIVNITRLNNFFYFFLLFSVYTHEECMYFGCVIYVLVIYMTQYRNRSFIK